MAEKDPPPTEQNYGPRNSFAPNDGYQYFEDEMAMNYERRRSSLRRNSSLVTDQDFKNQAYGMLRKRKNPRPNLSDRMLYKMFRLTKIYLPISSLLALIDFVLDWRNAVQLISSDKCSQKAFGSMMFSTVLIIPMVFAIIQRSPEEYDMWEMIFRGLCGVEQKDPFGDVDEEKAPIHVRLFANLFYVIFSPFTHLVTQMSLHTNSAEKVEFYMEFDTRKAKVMKQLHLGCFTSYDGDELDRLKELQFRATHYVQYYIKYAKDRLRYCLIEDTLQFNIQFAMFMYAMFTAPQDHPSSFSYLETSRVMGFPVHPETKLVADAATYVGGLITSVLMMWQGYFQIERYHEQLMFHNNIGLIRVAAICVKTMIELLLPPLSLAILMVNKPIVEDAKSEIMLTKCETSDWFMNMLKFYLLFLVFFSYGINFIWSFILNYSNRGSSTAWPIFIETTRMSVYTSVISVKYNRIAEAKENVIEMNFTNNIKAVSILCAANFVKFLPMFIVVLFYVPNFYPSTRVMSYAVTNDISYVSYLNMKLRYDSDELTRQISPPYLEINSNIDIDLTVAASRNNNLVCSGTNRDCILGFYDKFQDLDNPSGGVVAFVQMDESDIVDKAVAGLDTHMEKIKRTEMGIDENGIKLFDINEATKIKLRKKAASLVKHKDAAEYVNNDDKWYEVIVTHSVYDNVESGEVITTKEVPRLSADEFARYMNKVLWTTSTPTGVKMKLFISVFLMYLSYSLTCIMSEPKIKSSKYFRSPPNIVKLLYPLVLPFLVIVASFRVERTAVENQLQSFCRLYPERVSQSSFVQRFIGYPIDCVNGFHFKSVERCSYGTVCFYDYRNDINVTATTDGGTYFGDPNYLQRLKVYNNPMALREEFLTGNSKKDISFIEATMTEIYKRLGTEPRLINTICLVNEEIVNSQFGDIFYDSKDPDDATKTIGECDKCQRVLASVAANNHLMQNFFSATYSGDTSIRTDAVSNIDAGKEFWENNPLFTAAESKDYIQRLKNHLNNELECYEFKGHKSVYNRTGSGFEDLEIMGEREEIEDSEYLFFRLFHDSCSTGFRRCPDDNCAPGKFIEQKTVNYLIEQTATDTTKSYIVFSDDQSEPPVFVNWPEQITTNPQEENRILPMIAEMTNFTMSQILSKTPNFKDDSDADSKNNLPLFNPYYHYAFDVYGSSTIRDLRSIPFKRMGEALNEIHDNVGPWMIPYEPPNIGPAVTNSLPSFQLRNDETKLIGLPFEVDIINMPRQLRLDTSSSLWHHYIHSILFPFSAPLPWWSTKEDSDQATIQKHTFTDDDAFMINSTTGSSVFKGQTLYRQVSPIISFLYEEIDADDNVISNSYFSVPIWAKVRIEKSSSELYGDLKSTKYNDWKTSQPEYVKKQDETTPWTEGAAVDGSFDSACWINLKDKAKVFGIGPTGNGNIHKGGTNMMEDQFQWSKVGSGNRQRFRVDEDYLIYGPGGEGLKRTALNPTIMQYQFDDKMRTAIRNEMYKGQSASANYDDGMGWAIDDALTTDGKDLSTTFNINMTYYLFTNVMTHMWPKDYDYRYPLPYSYEFDIGHSDILGQDPVPGEDKPLTTPCTDGSYKFLDGSGAETGKQMWCIGGPIAFDPNSKPTDTYDDATPMDLRDVVLGRVYKPQAKFIRDNTDFFPFMDLGDPFINQTFVDSHSFGMLHKFWDTPSRLKIYNTTKPYSHYKTRFDNNMLGSPAWYKPYVDVTEHHDSNLKHVNTYVADVTVTGTVVSDYFDKYKAIGYHQKIREHIDPAEYEGTRIKHRMLEPEGEIRPLLDDRTAYGLENWQRLYTRKNKVSLNSGWHFFGKEWDYDKFTMAQKLYTSDEDFLDGNEYYSEILDMDYSLYNVLPNSPTFVRTSSITDREAECLMSQPTVNQKNYRKPIAIAPGGDAMYCDPNIHYVISRPDFVYDKAMTLEDVQNFSPGSVKWDEKKTYTDFNYGDLHISKPCLAHNDKAYIFAQVRRLKPFYYFYCDKWINDMTSTQINLATDGGKISTRPCSKRVMDPLNRFQPWDTNPQTAFRNRDVDTVDTAKNEILKRPFILSDPEIVNPYSLVFTYDSASDSFDSVTVLPNGVSPQRGSCISSKHYPGVVEKMSLLCFGGIIKGRATNLALGLIDNAWKTSNDKDAGFISEMALPVPLIDHTVLEVGKKLYILGGKTLLSHFKSNTEKEILDRGHNFMRYGYRKDFPLPADRDHEFVEENTPFKSFHKVSGEQMYPPVFGKPEEYGILGHSTKTTRTGDNFLDYEESDHVFVFTGTAAGEGTGWQISRRPVKTKKWSIQSAFYKRNYAYIFTPGGTNGIVSRYSIYRRDIILDANFHELESEADSSRKRRSMDYVREMQGGKYSANTGPFLNARESKLLNVKNDDETFFPNDWSTIMGEYFADDYHSGQVCKMCDAPSKTISFQKLRNEDTPFRKVETPDQKITRAGIAMVMEITHDNLMNVAEKPSS